MKSHDEFLEKRIRKYDKWLASGLISFSSKIIPVSVSVSPKQWVLPSEQAISILDKASYIAVQPCECRSHYNRCDHPIEVCLAFNNIAENAVKKEEAKPVSKQEAYAIMDKACQSGLVHLALYMPDHEVFAICSCCPCCCHDLQIVREFKRKDLLVKSDYLAVTDHDKCILCSECIDRCPFEARRIHGNTVILIENNCLGCSQCVNVCPEDAISMYLHPLPNNL